MVIFVVVIVSVFLVVRFSENLRIFFGSFKLLNLARTFLAVNLAGFELVGKATSDENGFPLLYTLNNF